MQKILFMAVLYFAAAVSTPAADSVRLKDLGKFAGWRENQLIGYGLVTGLAGTGDSPNNRATRQSLANVLAQFDVVVPADQITSRNTAAVMVTASLPPFANEGDTLDVIVTSTGDARSLTGGTLLITPLKAVNNKVYALAQGPLSVGGYKYDLNGNVVQKNHPTVGAIPGGATVEVGIRAKVLDANNLVTFLLTNPDYTTASRVATAINGHFGAALARPRDAEGIEIQIPGFNRDNLVEFMTRIERLNVEPDQRAKVIVNERTGTVVSGGDVRIAKVVISHGDLKVSIVTENTASQPILVRQTGPDVRTELVSNSRIDAQEKNETGFVSASNNTIGDLVQALTKIKTSTRDIISILRAIKTAGALHAELVIQ